MSIPHLVIALGGAAAAGTVALLGSNGLLHKGAVAVASGCMAASDAVTARTQSIMDDAADRRAASRRQAKIDAAVKERLSAVEEGIRDEVTAAVDGEAVEAQA